MTTPSTYWTAASIVLRLHYFGGRYFSLLSRKYREEYLAWDALFENLHPSLALRRRPLFCPCSSESEKLTKQLHMKSLTKRLLALALAVSAALAAEVVPAGSEIHGKEYCQDYSVFSFSHIP